MTLTATASWLSDLPGFTRIHWTTLFICWRRNEAQHFLMQGPRFAALDIDWSLIKFAYSTLHTSPKINNNLHCLIICTLLCQNAKIKQFSLPGSPRYLSLAQRSACDEDTLYFYLASKSGREIKAHQVNSVCRWSVRTTNVENIRVYTHSIDKVRSII